MLRQLWIGQQATPNHRFRVTIVDWEAHRKVESLCLRYPRLAEICDMRPQSIDVRGPAFQRGDFLFDHLGRCDVTAIYICLDDDSLGLSTALILRQRLRGERVPIVVRTEQDTGLARLMEGMHPGDDGFEDLHAFALLDRTCTPDLLLAGTHEILACAVHEGYVGSRDRPDPSAEDAPAAVPWLELPEAYRESSRRYADHIGAKLRAVGCALAQQTDWQEDPLQFSHDEVEIMARMEHERWMEDRLSEGWTRGVRDDEKKTHPYLIDWEELPDEIKELNRDMVRPLSATLAEVGLEVYRPQREEA
jgi:hypothetical protein